MPGKASKVKLAKLPSREAENSNSRRTLETLFSWRAPSRIWRPKTKVWYLSSAALVLAVMLFVVLSKYPSYPWLILMMIAFLALWFIHGTIPPIETEHRITNKGFYTYSILYTWDDIARFWLAKKENQHILYLDFPRHLREPRITILIDKEDLQEIFELMISHLKYSTPAEAEYNFVSRIIYGEYLPISQFLPDLDKA